MLIGQVFLKYLVGSSNRRSTVAGEREPTDRTVRQVAVVPIHGVPSEVGVCSHMEDWQTDGQRLLRSRFTCMLVI